MEMKEERILLMRRYDAPCGTLWLGAADGHLCLCDWLERRAGDAVREHRWLRWGLSWKMGDSATADEAARQLDEYFSHRRERFDVPLWQPGTPFQQEVWSVLEDIPYGATETYAGLADRLGRRQAMRAVAAAVGANLLSIFIPCHRVLGSDGRLTGYAGGLSAKRFLLEWEGIGRER